MESSVHPGLGARVGRFIRLVLTAPVAWPVFGTILALPYLWFGVVLGATFWIDGFCYAGLGTTLSDAAAYREFNTGYGRLALSHLQIGLPTIQWLLDRLPSAWQWPLFEAAQRLVAWGALLYALAVLSDGKPRVLHLLGGLVIAGTPFLQSFHNAFMSESLSGSLLLVGFALSVAIFRAPRVDVRLVASLVVVVFLVTQFRSYYGVIVLALAAAALVLGRLPGRVPSLIVIVCGAVLAGLFYPAVRWVAMGDWFLPGVGVNRLLVATYMNPAPGSKIREKIREFPPPERRILRTILKPSHGFTVDDAKRLVLLMLDSGMSEREVDTKLQALGTAILTERPDLIVKRLRHGLASSGFLETSLLWSDGVEMFRGRSPEAYARHQRDVLAWHSWLAHEDYRTSFASFFATPRDVFPATESGQEWIRRTQERYVAAPMSRGMRDPLALGLVPPDVWAWAGLLAAVGLIARGNIVGVLVLGAVTANFLVAFTVPVGNPRYAYGIIPLYPLAIVALLSMCLRLPGESRLRFSLVALWRDLGSWRWTA